MHCLSSVAVPLLHNVCHFAMCVQINVATSLVAGGETGIFTPMHLLVFQKPEANGEDH